MAAEAKGMSVFERYLSMWVALCMVAGVIIGQLDIQVIGEGVENAAERDALVGLGCDLLQGYLFARPARAFAAPAF